jgi:hypothetical protein
MMFSVLVYITHLAFVKEILDLFDPLHVSSLIGKNFVFVIINYTRFTWVLFLTHKDKAIQAISNFSKSV